MKRAITRVPEDTYRVLFENVGDAVFVIGEDGSFLDANHQAEKLTGYTGCAYSEELERKGGETG